MNDVRWWYKVPGVNYEILWPAYIPLVATIAVLAAINPATAAMLLCGVIMGAYVRHLVDR